jgi:hypothetical protein
VYIENELGDLQKKKVEMLVDKFLDMNIYEIRYFSILMKDKIQKTSGINPMKLNLDWPSIKQDGNFIFIHAFRFWHMASCQPQLV